MQSSLIRPAMPSVAHWTDVVRTPSIPVGVALAHELELYFGVAVLAERLDSVGVSLR